MLIIIVRVFITYIRMIVVKPLKFWDISFSEYEVANFLVVSDYHSINTRTIVLGLN